MKKYKYCRCCTIKNDINNVKCSSCQADLDDIIYTDKKMLYIFLSFLVCLIIFIIDRILIANIPTAPSYLEAYFYFTYLLIFALCYILFSKLDSPKLSNRGAMTAAIKVTKAISFVKNPTVYSYMESSKNINERIINKLVNKRTFFILVFLGLILLLVSLMFGMKYDKELDYSVNVIMMISMILIMSPVFIIQIMGLAAQIKFYIRTKK